MKQKPKSPKYHNLTARGGVVYYERLIDGKRHRFSCRTDDWKVAVAVRDEYEQRKGIGKGTALLIKVPSFREFADRYLKEDTSHLAATTQDDRESHLREDGPLMAFFGERKLDEITPPHLREWWNVEILGRGRTVATGRSYLSALAGLLGYAQDLGILESSPLPVFREQLRRRSHTKGARAAADAGANIRPIESLEELKRLTEAAFREAEMDFRRDTRPGRGGVPVPRPLHERTGGLRGLVAVLAMLDAGLRMGEVAALTWGQVHWGRDEDDLGRALLIDRARPRGREEGPPKSGRNRTVALSRRLRRALETLYRFQYEPGPTARLLPSFEPHNFTNRAWRRILKRAEIGHRAPKDLRDTYASWLLSLGVQLGYVSQQLGHSDVAVTARHYAKWCGGNLYREPMPLLPGELPADLLARVIESPQSPLSLDSGAMLVREEASDYGDLLVAQGRIELPTPAFSVRCSTN